MARIVAVLDKAQLPADAGQKACRQVLTDRGQKTSNDALREAIQRRRRPAEAGGKPVEKVAETVPATPRPHSLGRWPDGHHPIGVATGPAKRQTATKTTPYNGRHRPNPGTAIEREGTA